MQLNPKAHTIEGVLFKALCEAGAVSPSNAVDPRKVQLIRCARTDRGVHAACNVVSLKMIIKDPQLINKINDLLPKDIRVWGFVETPRGFHAKNQCDSRIYEYLLPTYTLREREKPILLKETPDSDKDIKILTKDSSLVRYVTPTDPSILLDYRVDQERLKKFKQAFSFFIGTHDFHNYTISKNPEKSTQRHIKQIDVSDPKLIEGMEWISVKLHGSSFMLHQIRKMISIAMLCVHTNASLSMIPMTFNKEINLNIPKAPATGLLLDRPVYEYYNEKVRSLGNKEPIEFDLYSQEIETFKQDFIYSHLFKQEQAAHAFESFLINVNVHLPFDYPYFLSIIMSRVNELVHAVANLSHVERPYLENLLAIKKLRLAKDPVDLELEEAAAKVKMWETEWINLNSWTFQWALLKLTCSLQEEKDRAQKGIKKSNELLREAEHKVQVEKDKIHQVETENEKYSVDHRTLEVYRQELTELLDSEGDVFSNQESLKQAVEDCKEQSKKKFEDMENLEKVKELLKEADSSILEGILELRSSTLKESMMGEGKVYFPNNAYDALVKARELYPDLPGFPSPTEYKNEKDDTGAYYSPMQKYLWDVRQKISELILWCDEEVIHLLNEETEIQIKTGQKLDEYNLSRRDSLGLY
ncbi:hypothetical protein G6F58_006661 [Rhizopus delemar]|nr:hypothetical protein G6F58_006661 [Rhizopus delemar]